MPHCHTLIETLRQRGYRVTPQREMIIEAVAHNSSHMTAEEILAAVQTHTHAMNVATVYRTMDFLVKEGLASRIDLGSDRVVYAARQHGTHSHLVCRQCGKVIETEPALLADLGQQLEARYGFQADLDHVSIFGICDHCRA